MGSAPDAKPDSEIVGVVENISHRNVREQWEAYCPAGIEMSGSNFYVRFRGTPESAFRSIRPTSRGAQTAQFEIKRDDLDIPLTVVRTGTTPSLPWLWIPLGILIAGAAAVGVYALLQATNVI